MTIIDCTLPPDKYIKQLEMRFRQTSKLYRETSKSKVKVIDVNRTDRYDSPEDLLITLGVSKATMLGRGDESRNPRALHNHQDDNIALLLIERELFIKHRWFIRVVTELSSHNYYENFIRQIDPSDSVVQANAVLETTAFVQKPIMDVSVLLTYRSKSLNALL